MIKDIKKLSTELQVKAFGDPGIFKQSEIKVIYPRSVEKPTPGITFLAQRRRSERGRTEVQAPSFPGVSDV